MNKELQWATADVPERYEVPAGQRMVVREEGAGILPAHHSTVVHVADGATLLYALTLHPDASAKRTITIELGAHAKAEFLACAFGQGDSRTELTVHEDHATGASWARTTVRGAMFQSSQLLLKGKISIRPEANQSDGLFEGRVMLLGEAAKAEIIPSLEIEARDVKATHAAAVGPLDNDALFYLMSRGCTPEQARTLLLEGFVQSLLTKLDDHTLRTDLAAHWTQLLTDHMMHPS